MSPVGYSGTPLVRKLGVTEGMRVAWLDAPPGLETLLERRHGVGRVAQEGVGRRHRHHGEVLRDVAQPPGLVDVKVCAIDATWSGLKLVIRRELR